ncbi:ABC transporter related protein [Thermaerobacter marianensis DSM 12885]|uniref:ABC transporter related protein n=1 Tax=Thermaerobacter marianensis (strain ATCC 700841 / DSM 12885 / JCM 10246 / 7p75a) TaxID=644966 RepID=E6SIR7_THEM7|nr:ABC transporter ATP-binding protein [Thermaerobacter marianensis]ADU52011.1 ABC transporter related protein [Thermaerobacter marianensis DSM 12885]
MDPTATTAATPTAATPGGIELEHVGKSFDGGNTWVVRDLTWRVEPGRITGLLGPNGAGKTTTLRMIAGILPPDRGTIRVGGVDVTRQPLDAKRRIGLVPDAPALYDRMTGAEFLRFLADVYGVPTAHRTRRMEELGRRLGIGDWVHSPIARYSLGLRQRLLLVGSLLHDPPVWILDEPIVGLDPEAARALKDLMVERSRRGGTVLMTTHLLEVAERLCDVVAIMHRGRLIAEGSPADLRRRFVREGGEEPAARPAAAGLPADAGLEDVFLLLTREPAPGGTDEPGPGRHAPGGSR